MVTVSAVIAKKDISVPAVTIVLLATMVVQKFKVYSVYHFFLIDFLYIPVVFSF